MILPINVVLLCLPKYRDQSLAPGTTRRSLVLFWPVLEVPTMHHHRLVLQPDTKSCIGEETKKRRSQWSTRLLGPGIVIGHEGLENVVD